MLSDRSFEVALSFVGAVALLGIVLLGPIALVPVAVPIVVAVIAAGRGPRRVAEERARTRRSVANGATPRPPATAADPWWAWRVVEPDDAYLRRRAA